MPRPIMLPSSNPGTPPPCGSIASPTMNPRAAVGPAVVKDRVMIETVFCAAVVALLVLLLSCSFFLSSGSGPEGKPGLLVLAGAGSVGSRPLGSARVVGLLATYAYRFHVWGASRWRGKGVRSLFFFGEG